MRDIEFLPDWYPSIQRRYRWVVAQGWITLLIVILISGYAAARRMQVRGTDRTSAQTLAQIDLSSRQLFQLDDKSKIEGEFRKQNHIAACLGVAVETTRLLKALEEAMTPEMALTQFSFSTVEVPGLVNAGRPSGSDYVDIDRRLKVVVNGIAPSAIATVTLMSNLSKLTYFENLTIELNETKKQNGHITHEFEVTFDIDLNAPAESTP